MENGWEGRVTVEFRVIGAIFEGLEEFMGPEAVVVVRQKAFVA